MHRKNWNISCGWLTRTWTAWWTGRNSHSCSSATSLTTPHKVRPLHCPPTCNANYWMSMSQVIGSVGIVLTQLDLALHRVSRINRLNNIRLRAGLEPSGLFNMVQFMMFDEDNSGSVTVDETMTMIYQRYGKDNLLKVSKQIRFGEWKLHQLLCTSRNWPNYSGKSACQARMGHPLTCRFQSTLQLSRNNNEKTSRQRWRRHVDTRPDNLLWTVCSSERFVGSKS